MKRIEMTMIETLEDGSEIAVPTFATIIESAEELAALLNAVPSEVA